MEHMHFAVYKDPYYAVDVEKRRQPDSPFLEGEVEDPYAIVQLNHYWTKSYREWLAKMMRGYGKTHPQRPFWEYEQHTAGIFGEFTMDQTMHTDFLPTLQQLFD